MALAAPPPIWNGLDSETIQIKCWVWDHTAEVVDCRVESFNCAEDAAYTCTVDDLMDQP